MANDEVIGPRKTMFVLVIVVGCFAVLWPRILSPLVLGPTREQIQPNQFDREAGCCEVIFETDVAVLELVNEVCSSSLGVGKQWSHSAAECRKAVNDTCGVDIAVFLKRNENVGKTTKMLVETMQNSNSSCLREHFGVPVYSLGPHLAAKSWNIKDTLKQERAPPMRGMGPHPALRERGRAIPPGPPGPPPPPATRPVTLPPHIRVRSPLSVYYENDQPPPIPGMRPPLGSPGGPVPAPKSSMGFVMPIYTICIIVFFVYTLTKILFRRQGAPYDTVDPDPQFRRRVFRDDSRSSPEKLGKKEADTIVTAISGLVAEVQQQMEASGAPNQQRQDVQDSARAYTNGTILLNSGPVQIVASEYKEASKEKTPEPNEKESTPEPKVAETTKVVKESVSKVDEPILEPLESDSKLALSSPESGIALQGNKTTPDSVAVTKSFPESVITEECREPTPDPSIPKDSTPEPIPKSSQAPLVSEEPEESISGSVPIPELKQSSPKSKEPTSEPKSFQDPAPKSNFNVSEATLLPDVSKDIAVVSDSEPVAVPRIDSTPELKPSELTIESKELLTKLVTPFAELTEPLQETNELSFEPIESSPGFKESAYKDSSLDLLETGFEPNEMKQVSQETIIEPKELLSQSQLSAPEHKESAPNLDDSPLHPEELKIDHKDHTIEPKESTPEPTDPSLDLVKSTPELTESSAKLDEPSFVSNETLLESKELALEHGKECEEPIVLPDEPSLEPTETSPELLIPLPDLGISTPQVQESISKSEEVSIQPSKTSEGFEVLSTELTESLLPTDPSTKLEESSVESKELSTELQESTSELPSPLLESKEPILDLNELPEPQISEFNASTSDLNGSIKESVETTPQHEIVTANLDQSIIEHKELSTQKESVSEGIKNSHKVEGSIVECSSESEFTKHSPEIEAPIDSSSDPEITKYSSEVVTPDIVCNLDPKDVLKIKEPASQSNETTSGAKNTVDPKTTIQGEENTSVPEGTLLDLEEAIEDIDSRTGHQQKEELEDINEDIKLPEQTDQNANEELLKISKSTEAVKEVKDDLETADDTLLQEERFVVVRRSTPDVNEENKKQQSYHSKPSDDYKLYTEADEEDMENAAVKVMGMEMTAHPVDGSEWPRDERPPPPATPASPPPRAPHAAEEVKSIFLETEIPQQSRVLVAQFQEDRPRPAAHAPLVVSGKMTLSLIQDAPRDTPERDPESTLDEFTTASAVTQPAAEKGEIESDEEIDEEIEVEEIELEEEEEEEEEDEPPPAKAAVKK